MTPEAAAPLELPEPELRELVEQCVSRYPTDGMRAVDELSALFPRLAEALRRRVAILERSGLLGPERPERRYPEQLGDFRLLELIGEGGMGAVFRAQQLSLGRLVALKVIRAENVYSPRSRERFQREIEAIAAMRSPGIVQVYTVGDDHGVPFYAMELVDGINLSDLVLELRRIPPERLSGSDIRATLARVVQGGDSTSTGGEADELFAGTYVQACCRLALRIARTLAYAHERGVLHRDVKPSNVMLDRSGRVLLLDFGLARAMQPETDALTRTGAVVGSLAYMAPEQMRGDKGIDGRVDVYGLGVTLYELLTHRAAFRGDTQEDLRSKVMSGVVPVPTQINPTIPSDAETICLRAMAPESARRYASAQAFADDLQRFLELRPIEARRSGAAYRVRRLAQRHPAKATAFTAGLLLAVGGPSLIAVQERLARTEIQGALAQAERYQKSYEHALKAALQGMERTTMRLAGDEQLATGKLDGLRRELLEGAAGFWQTMADVDDPHPSVRDALMQARRVLATVRGELGDLAGARLVLDGAVAELERACQAATDTQRPSLEQDLAKMLLEQAQVMATQHDWLPAIAAWSRSIEIGQASLPTAPNPKATRRHIARCRLNIAQVQRQNSDARSAAATCREVIETLGDAGDADLLLLARTQYSSVLMYDANLEAARPELEAVVALRDERERLNPGDAGNLRGLKTALHNLGYLHQQLRDLPSAREAIERAAVIARRLVEAFPDRLEDKLGLVSSLIVLGNVCLRQQDKVRAESVCRDALALAEAMAVAHAEVREVNATLAQVRGGLAQAIGDNSAHYSEAASLLRAAKQTHAQLARAPEATAQDLAHLGTTQGLLASALSRLGEPEEARVAEAEALATLAAAAQREPDSPNIRRNTATVLSTGIVRALVAGDHGHVRALLQKAAPVPALDAELWTLLRVMPAEVIEQLEHLRALAADK